MITVEIRDAGEEDTAGTEEVVEEDEHSARDEGLRGICHRRVEETVEEEELAASEELAEAEEFGTAEQGCVDPVKAVMGWQLLGNQAIAQVAGASHGGGRAPEKPAGLAVSGSAEAHEEFHECEEFAHAFGQQYRIECNVVGPSGDVGGQRAGRKLVHGVLCDTGAGATVADGSFAFPEFPLESSPGSRQGQTFVGPGRDAIENRGERKVHLRLGSEQGRKAGMKFQDAKVRRPILSVGESTGLGNSFWYDQEGSHILPVNCMHRDQTDQGDETEHQGQTDHAKGAQCVCPGCVDR